MTKVLIMCLSTIHTKTLAQGKLDKHLEEFERAGEPLKIEPNCWTSLRPQIASFTVQFYCCNMKHIVGR